MLRRDNLGIQERSLESWDTQGNQEQSLEKQDIQGTKELTRSGMLGLSK